MTPERLVLAEVLESDDIGGFPAPTVGELAERIELALARRGYKIVPIVTSDLEIHSRGGEERLAVASHPCTCHTKPWCIKHPFGPPRA